MLRSERSSGVKNRSKSSSTMFLSWASWHSSANSRSPFLNLSMLISLVANRYLDPLSDRLQGVGLDVLCKVTQGLYAGRFCLLAPLIEVFNQFLLCRGGLLPHV